MAPVLGQYVHYMDSMSVNAAATIQMSCAMFAATAARAHACPFVITWGEWFSSVPAALASFTVDIATRLEFVFLWTVTTN